MDELLNGIYDCHIHTAPDSVPRKCSDLEAARRMLASGMAGGVVKSHFLDTSARAGLLMEQFPRLKIAGGIALNRSAGGLNADAVERCGQAGGKLVWFPTLESREYQSFYHNPDVSRCLSVLDERGKLLPAALEVMDAAKQYGMVVCTGHIGPEESRAVVREAARRGCTLLVTHADNPACRSTDEMQAEAVHLGAMIEHSFYTTYFGLTPIGEIARQIRSVGVENVILTTDFGQPKSPFFDEGMAQYGRLLLGQGFTEQEFFQMTRTNPERLLGWDRT